MPDPALLFNQLQRFTEKNDLNKVIKTADVILNSGNGHKKAIHCKIVALLQLDRFHEALAVFDKFPEFTKELLFEKAYCLYRMKRVEEALLIIESCRDKNELKFRELLGQLYYRLERYEECYQIYRDLMKETADEYDDERKTNFTASIAQLANRGQVIDRTRFCPDGNSTEPYEVMFNTACYLMSLEKYDEAEVYLSAAEKLCAASLEEDPPDEELDCELNVINTQMACCKHFQKKISPAIKMYTKILEKKPSDGAVIAVINNNILAANLNRNVFETKKKVKLLQSDGVMSMLTNKQRRIVVTNMYVIDAMNAPSVEHGLKQCDSLASEYPETVEVAALLKAAVFMKFNNINGAIDILEKQYINSLGSKLQIGLAVAQLYLNIGKYEEACRTLKALGEDIYKPGVVSTLVIIMIALGESQGASDLLESAAEWNERTWSTSGEMFTLWQQAADLHLKRGQTRPALDCLLQLLKIKPNDYRVLSKLTLVYAKMKDPKAFGISEQLRELLDLSPEQSVTYFESSEWIMNLKGKKKLSKKDQSPGTPLPNKNIEHHSTKKKKKRLPKNYNPEVAPDPERWMPMFERSYFKKKKDRRNKDIGKGTQGACSPATEQYDITKMTSQMKGKTVSSVLSDSQKVHLPKMQRHKKKKGGKR